MDLLASCRDKLANFRIKELKDVLTQLGLAKQGKKQDLVDRILQLLSDEQVPKSQIWGRRFSLGNEEVAKIIDDIYRKMQVSGATDLASKNNVTGFKQIKPKEEIEDYRSVQCPCRNSMDNESTIQCMDPRCRVWQHIGCVIIPEKSVEGALPELPSCFYCELCRMNRADPFWVRLGQPLLLTKLISSVVTTEGTVTLQSVERTFQFSRINREMTQRNECDLQVWCLLLNDKVPFRMHWPQFAELQVNGIAVRVVNRPGSQLLGINGRDDGPLINTFCKEGINKINLSWRDTRVFCFGIRLVRRRSVHQVRSLVPKEEDGESFETALARVCRCIGGGAATDDAEDSDVEVVADCVTVNLRCPMSGSRIRTAGRFKPCMHMGCFDLEAFVELNQRSRKWQCPICLQNYSLENIIVDPFFNRITSLLQNCGEDVTEIDVKPDGSWRVKNEGVCTSLSKWHLPDSSLPVDTHTEVKAELGDIKPVKEDTPKGHTSLRLKRNREGVWEVSKKPLSSPTHVFTEHDDHSPIIPLSSSPAGSYVDVEGQSDNQDTLQNYEFSLNGGHDLDYPNLDFDPTYNIESGDPPASSKNADIIILSDSDDYDDRPNLISPKAAYDSRPTVDSEIPFSIHTGVSERYTEDTGLATIGSSGLGLFENSSDDFDIPIWPMQTCPQTSSGFQLFEMNSEVQDPLDVAHNTLDCTSVHGYNLASNGSLGGASETIDYSACHSRSEVHGTLIDNPLAFPSNDPSLQIFLPAEPTSAPLQCSANEHLEVPNGAASDDWISLTLAAGGSNESTSVNRSRPKQQSSSRDKRIEPLEETALLLGMSSGNGASKSNLERFCNPFSHPKQPRSARARLLYMPIDPIDSDSN
ncbi:E3 SUMO-protein ligase SIZ1-like isoform X2 [Curcuma longa]|uniref:E3 SUMO-protein ligase SIZ1-like isoform X2 n=1 Tax=Curcuma longa TaxID=136217 RepID=UPI003D9E5221